MRSAKIRHEVLAALAVAGLCVASGQAGAESSWSNFAPGGEWIVRGGAGIADPQGDSTGHEGNELETDDSDTQFVGDLTWMFTPNWGVELFGSTPFEHKLVEREADTGDVLGEGSLEYIPWTLSLQYHFLPDSFFRPYLGAGVTYAWMKGDEPPEIDLDGDFGFGGGAGIDFGQPDGKWLFNVAVKYIDLSLDGDAPDSVKFTAAIDPLIYSASVGYKFGRAAAPVEAAPAAAVAAAAPAAKPSDADGDGVLDADDKCPDTPKGDRVGPHGCSCDVSVQLQFKFDSAELTAEDMATLDRVAARLNELKFVGGEISGHTDSTGDDAYNMDLSKRRAQSVLEYLESKGVAAGRMTSVGYGETKPIADNATPEGRAKNRRVVIRRTDCGPA